MLNKFSRGVQFGEEKGFSMLRVKKGLCLRRLEDDYYVFLVGDPALAFNGMIRLNGTGAFYWIELEKGISKKGLIEKTVEEFENANIDLVTTDVEKFLESVSFALEDL